ncbi:hypothetical protein SAMN02745866_00304 [Alteromonadaceae bacterium Bs31]|nr:hypothetical protein SAMN02745866_00304 [Alteromonadaceae bacterium Bs31]
MNPELLILFTIFAATGIALLFVGSLITLLVSLGNRHHIFGALLFLFLMVPLFLARQYHWLGAATVFVIPLVLVYFYQYPEQTRYARKIFVPGLIVSVLTALVAGLTYWFFGFSL